MKNSHILEEILYYSNPWVIPSQDLVCSKPMHSGARQGCAADSPAYQLCGKQLNFSGPGQRALCYQRCLAQCLVLSQRPLDTCVLLFSRYLVDLECHTKTQKTDKVSYESLFSHLSTCSRWFLKIIFITVGALTCKM